MCHITGGGFYENVPRMLKDGQGVLIHKDAFERPAIFDFIMETGNIPEHEMYNVFNMGIGFIMAVDPADVDRTLEILKENDQPASVIGEITDSGKVELK